MGMSEIKGGRVIDALAELIDPVCEIALDEEAAALFRPQQPEDGKTALEIGVERIRVAGPKLLKNHKAAIVTIMATLKGVGTDEYENGLTLTSFLNDLYELITDDEFAAFLS